MYNIEKLTKKPLEWVYICWTKSERNPRYLLPKLTLPQQKQISSSSEIFTLKVRTGETGGQQGISYCGFFLVGVFTIELKISKIKIGRITFPNFVHSISHCTILFQNKSNFKKMAWFLIWKKTSPINPGTFCHHLVIM